MKKVTTLFLSIFTLMTAQSQNEDNRYYELRTYYSPEGKRPDLIKRFQNHTVKLFEDSGMENLGYFLPIDESNQTLVYFLSYPDKAARDVSWKQFLENPKWKKVHKKSIKKGELVSKIDEVFLTEAPELNPETNVKLMQGDKIFELRTYTCLPGKLENLNARFRDHTLKLFEKHGMVNLTYWFTEEKSGEQPKLVYLLAHKNMEAAKASWDAFRVDPDWISARDASEAEGKIVEKVESLYLKALPFSAVK